MLPSDWVETSNHEGNDIRALFGSETVRFYLGRELRQKRFQAPRGNDLRYQ